MEKNKCKGFGGFPPLYKVTEEYKKKREFSKKMTNIDKNKLEQLNILNVKDFLYK